MTKNTHKTGRFKKKHDMYRARVHSFKIYKKTICTNRTQKRTQTRTDLYGISTCVGRWSSCRNLRFSRSTSKRNTFVGCNAATSSAANTRCELIFVLIGAALPKHHHFSSRQTIPNKNCQSQSQYAFTFICK